MTLPSALDIDPDKAILILAQSLDFPEPDQLRYRPRAALIVQNQRILWHGDRASLPRPVDQFKQCYDYGHAWLMPGFIDTHVHCAQLPVIASWGTQLLDWLNRYTFPAERRFEHLNQARDETAFFIDQLFTHGTTTAMVFGTVHEDATTALFELASERNMALVAGKVLMDRHCPDYLQDTPQSGYDASARLIERWHKQGRARYAITPRFAPTSSEAQLEQAGALLTLAEGLYVQTHIAENFEEIAWVKSLFPWSEHYSDVYERYGLLNSRTVLAHGIHLAESEWQLLAEKQSRIAVCPTSNTFLGSGLFPYSQAEEKAVQLGLASDVGGGTSLSMLVTAAEAYKVGQLTGAGLTGIQLAHAITAGNARVLHLENEIGTLDAGKMADLVVLDTQAQPLLKQRLQWAESVEEQLFAVLMLGNERLVEATWVAGQIQYRRLTAS